MLPRFAFAAALSLGLLASTGHAQPMAASLEALPLDHLKSAYLACERASSERVLDGDSFAHCAGVGDALLQRGFGGDFDRLLAWWRSEKTKARQAQAKLAPPR
ncbi:MAG: hypothetical protein ABI699_06370 [Caldimonas sp.]